MAIAKTKHTIFWVLYALFIFFIFSVLTDFIESFFRTSGLVGMQMLMFYLNYNVLIPKYYANKKYVTYGALNSLLLFCTVVIVDFLIRVSYYIRHDEGYEDFNFHSILTIKHFEVETLEFVFNYMMPIILAIFISFLFYNFSQQKLREEKEMLLAKAEKNFLVSQINPHFLFNTLNNIYALSLTNDTKGSLAIMHLSKMLDYSLYGARKEQVSLKDEIQYINYFIELFKLKDDAIENVNFNFSGADPSFRIAPMLLIPFVENAFKHGNIEDLDNGYIDIELTTKPDEVIFKVKNSYKPQKSVDASSGIGIANVKRRLDLIYLDRHKLNIEKYDNDYLIVLTIDVGKTNT